MNAMLIAGLLLAAIPAEKEKDQVKPALVTVQTKIAGAIIYLDRQESFEANTAFDVDPGAHELLVVAEGYYDLPLYVDLKAGQKKKLRVRAMVKGTSTYADTLPGPSGFIYTGTRSDWSPADPSPYSMENEQLIVRGKPLPGKGSWFSFSNRYRSTNYVIRFEYRIVSGSVNVVPLGITNAPSTPGWHTVIVEAKRTGSRVIIDWRAYNNDLKKYSVDVSYRKGTSGEVRFRNFSFTDIAAKQEAEQGK